MPTTSVKLRFRSSNAAKPAATEDEETPLPSVKKGKKESKEPLKEAPKKKKKGTITANENHVGSDGVPKLRGKYKVVKPDELKPNPWNYNEQSDFVYGKLKESIKEFGFSEPITVRSSNEHGPLGHYEIVGGEHRWKAATELGMPEIPITDIGMMPDASLKKFMIVLNETKGRPNNDQMAAVLSELVKDGVDVSVLPYDQAEIDSLVSMGDFDWSAAEATGTADDTGTGGGDDEEEEGAYDAIYEVLDLEGMPESEDAAIGKRLIELLRVSKTSPTRPWTLLNKLIDTYYKANKLTEKVAVATDDDGEEEEEDEEGEDDDK